MNALYFYRSFLKKVRSQLGEPAYLHMNSPLQCNFFPCNATYFTRIKVNVCYVSVDIFMADVFYINFGKNVFSFIIFFATKVTLFATCLHFVGALYVLFYIIAVHQYFVWIGDQQKWSLCLLNQYLSFFDDPRTWNLHSYFFLWCSIL